ncbi:rho guanine nucleotide exchange factor 28 [Pelodytes ibericus]
MYIYNKARQILVAMVTRNLDLAPRKGHLHMGRLALGFFHRPPRNVVSEQRVSLFLIIPFSDGYIENAFMLVISSLVAELTVQGPLSQVVVTQLISTPVVKYVLVSQYRSECVLVSQYRSECVLVSQYGSECVLVSQYGSECVLVSQYGSECVLVSQYGSECGLVSQYGSECGLVSQYGSECGLVSQYGSECGLVSQYGSECGLVSQYGSECGLVSQYGSECGLVSQYGSECGLVSQYGSECGLVSQYGSECGLVSQYGSECGLVSQYRSECGLVSQYRSECGLVSQYRSECGLVSQYRSECGLVSQYNSECGLVSQYRSECGLVSQYRSECGLVSQYGSECGLVSQYGSECGLVSQYGSECCLVSQYRSECGLVSQYRSECGLVSQYRSECGLVSQYRSECGLVSQYRSECGLVSQYRSKFGLVSQYRSECGLVSQYRSECGLVSQYRSECGLGQMTVFAKFGEDVHLPEDAEFYFVYNGSHQRHVMFAERVSPNTLQSIFPGHSCVESLIVTVCMHTHGYSSVIVACASLVYVKDTACDVSHFLKTHCDRLTPTSHETILGQFGMTVKDLQLVDRNMMLCLAHEELTPAWNILGSRYETEDFCHETLLHLTMRWGLIELSHFLMYRPGGASALTIENEEGDTPIDLASRNGHTRLVELLRNFQDAPPLDFCTTAINEDSFLRFCQSSGVFTLTRLQPATQSLEADIELLRKCLWDTKFFEKIISSSPDRNPTNQKSQEDASVEEGLFRGSCIFNIPLPTERLLSLTSKITQFVDSYQPKHTPHVSCYLKKGAMQSNEVSLSGSVFTTSGSVFTTSGSVFTTSGSCFTTSGTVFTTSGSCFTTSGTVFTTSGTVFTTSGTVFTTSGTVFTTSGSVFTTSGTVFTTSGTVFTTSGSVFTTSGTVFTTSGTVFTTSGTVFTTKAPGSCLEAMDSDSDSPFNYSWPSFPKMRIQRRSTKQEKRYSSIDASGKLKSPPTFVAAARLSAMLNGNDEVYSNCMVVDEVSDSDITYIQLGGANIDQSDSAPPSEISLKENNYTVCTSPGSSSAEVNNVDVAESPAYFSSSKWSSPKRGHWKCQTIGYGNERNASHNNIKKRSSSLDGLEADSEDEGSYVGYHSPDSSVKQDSSGLLENSADELESPGSTCEQRFHIRKSGTLPLSQGKDPLRFRSYSCSSPKVFLGKPRLTRDLSVGDPCDDGAFVFKGRSLLQALSLSKSVSLLQTGKQRAYSLPEHSREKRYRTHTLYFYRIEEEEWEKFATPTKPESEKNKVSRTFSFLRNRMTSTRNKNKTKNKDGKEKEKVNRHQFVMGTFSGVVPCLVCEKAMLGKESLQCSNCNVNVHKSCKDSTPPCTKKFQERYHPKTKQSAVISNSSFKDIPQPVISSIPQSPSMPVGLSTAKKDLTQPVHPLSKSVPVSISEKRSEQSLESDGDTSGSRSRSQSEELLHTMGSPPAIDSFPIEDVVDTPLWSDFSKEAQEFEAESWSLVVDSSFCSRHEKHVIKRQDVIFELIQTESHHIQTLLIMSEIFRKGMKEELQLDHSTVDKIFPCLDELLQIHRQFFYSMRERKQESREGGNRNFVINRIGDILMQQFSAENAGKMKQLYGEFCSHHIEAVNVFKELQQNKKFQNFIRLKNNNLLARRRGIPECILLVTQRITKYPVLVERILQHTPEGTEEHKDLSRALGLIKDVIAAVDLRVNEFEKEQKLLEILNKIENKTFTKMKNGHAFRKQDLQIKERALLHEGMVFWKTATGRFKDIQALLLTDVLLFLQEKDQKYIFAAVDQKPPVICLQKLIVREVANEERGMFLISASSAGPEMYEIHTSSKEDRNSWMRQIQEAVQRCPEEDEGKTCESDEDKRVAEARAAKAHKFQEQLMSHDQQICNYLEEKLQIYVELAALCGGNYMNAEPQLLIKADSGEIPQATTLLTAALKEAENLYSFITSQLENSSCISEEPEESMSPTSCVDGLIPEDTEEIKLPADPSVSPTGDGDLSYNEEKGEAAPFPSSSQAEVLQAIQNLTRLLYSIQATVAMQDSHIELHRVLLQDNELINRGICSRGNLLQEQEKYRHLEKHRGEVVNIQKLQHQFHQEQQRWLRECDQKQREHDEKENVLQQREKDCQSQEHILWEKQEELGQQVQEFQQNLERLKEGQRLVEKEREELGVQHKLLRHWKHTRQNSMPVIFSHSKIENTRNHKSDGLQSEDFVYANNALAQIALNNTETLPKPDYVGASTDNCSVSNLAQTTENNASNTSNEHWSSMVSRTQRLDSSSFSTRHSNKDICNNDLNAAHVISCGTLLASSSGGQHLNPECTAVPQSTDSLNSPLGGSAQSADNERVEENIVYL